MQKLKSFVFICCCLIGSAEAAYAMEGVFDRNAEVEKYIETIQSGTQGAAAVAAREIYSSGISDRRLADAVNKRLLSDYAALTAPQRGALPGPARIALNASTRTVDEEYGVWMTRALASFGIDEYAATFQQIERHPKLGGAQDGQVRKAAKDAATRIAWHRRKNEIIASRENHHDGDDPNATMTINLLVAEDRTYRHEALDKIYREKMRDPRILSVLDQQVLLYATQAAGAGVDKKDSLVAKNIKWLGLSGDSKYRGTMEKVLASSAAPGIKKYAQIALDQLQ